MMHPQFIVESTMAMEATQHLWHEFLRSIRGTLHSLFRPTTAQVPPICSFATSRPVFAFYHNNNYKHLFGCSAVILPIHGEGEGEGEEEKIEKEKKPSHTFWHGWRRQSERNGERQGSYTRTIQSHAIVASGSIADPDNLKIKLSEELIRIYRMEMDFIKIV